MNEKEGRNITGKMRLILEGMGYAVPLKHKSKTLTQALIDWCDKIVVMEQTNKKRLLKNFPGTEKDIIVLEVPDPHFQKGIEHHRNAALLIENKLKQICVASSDTLENQISSSLKSWFGNPQ